MTKRGKRKSALLGAHSLASANAPTMIAPKSPNIIPVQMMSALRDAE
jgi:hypothetical protein